MNRAIIAQIESTLRQKDTLLCTAIINTPNLFPFIPAAAAEEKCLRILARRLLRSGLSPVQAARHIRDATRRIYLFVLQGPIALRGRAWFGKEGLHHQLMDIQRHHRYPSQINIQNKVTV